ncbi:MAG: helix-turn-helix transcriptional regulator [Clostridiales bacterium]|nr:helix-turn-helix transcriptional regulator [Clostridiales bacterium]
MCREPLVSLFLRITKKRKKHMELSSIEIGKRIKMIRLKKRLSQIAFAAELHVSREQISRWENGSKIPALDILCQLSEIGKVSMDHLITSQEKDGMEKKMISVLLGDLLELDRKIDRVIELVTETGIM